MSFSHASECGVRLDDCGTTERGVRAISPDNPAGGVISSRHSNLANTGQVVTDRLLEQDLGWKGLKWDDLRACLSPHISTVRPINMWTEVEVQGVAIYEHDVKVVKGLTRKSWNERNSLVFAKKKQGYGWGKRGQVYELSKESLLRFLHTARNGGVEWLNMSCLTYPKEFPTNGKIVKRHLNTFLTAMRRKYGNQGKRLSYVWFQEFQRRGAVHIHMFDNVKTIDREWLAKTWYRIVGSGDEKHLAAGTSWDRLRKRDGAIRYAAKYAAKRGQKTVPEGFENVSRFWGNSYDVKPKAKAFIKCDALELLESVKFAATRFMSTGQDGKMWWRNYLWDCAEFFKRSSSIVDPTCGSERPESTQGSLLWMKTPAEGRPPDSLPFPSL